MSEEIFRKKSLDKVKSPESLDDYIKVSNPGIWLLLISVIALLAGAFVWGVFGHIDSTVPAAIRVNGGEAVCCIAAEDMASVQVGATVRFAEHQASISAIGEMDADGYHCTLSMPDSPADGFYEGAVVIQRYKPLSFILN